MDLQGARDIFTVVHNQQYICGQQYASHFKQNYVTQN